MKLINQEITSINHEIESQSREINSINHEIRSINQEMEYQSTKIMSLVLENTEIKDTVLQMNARLYKILLLCKFYSSIIYFLLRINSF